MQQGYKNPEATRLAKAAEGNSFIERFKWVMAHLASEINSTVIEGTNSKPATEATTATEPGSVTTVTHQDTTSQVSEDAAADELNAVPVNEPDVVVPQNISVIAAQLVRDIESVARRGKLVVQHRSYVNPTIRRKLITALNNEGRDIAEFAPQLSEDFPELPTNGKCHQRIVREMMAKQPDPDMDRKTETGC